MSILTQLPILHISLTDISEVCQHRLMQAHLLGRVKADATYAEKSATI